MSQFVCVTKQTFTSDIPLCWKYPQHIQSRIGQSPLSSQSLTFVAQSRSFGWKFHKLGGVESTFHSGKYSRVARVCVRVEKKNEMKIIKMVMLFALKISNTSSQFHKFLFMPMPTENINARSHTKSGIFHFSLVGNRRANLSSFFSYSQHSLVLHEEIKIGKKSAPNSLWYPNWHFIERSVTLLSKVGCWCNFISTSSTELCEGKKK